MTCKGARVGPARVERNRTTAAGWVLPRSLISAHVRPSGVTSRRFLPADSATEPDILSTCKALQSRSCKGAEVAA